MIEAMVRSPVKALEAKLAAGNESKVSASAELPVGIIAIGKMKMPIKISWYQFLRL